MSSYRGSFHDLSPSDQADIASFSEPDDHLCFLCDAGGICNGECEQDIEETLQAQVIL